MALKEKYSPYILGFLFLFHIALSAQQLKFEVTTEKEENQIHLTDISYSEVLPDSSAVKKAVDSIRKQLQIKGFLNNRLAYIEKNKLAYRAVFILGPQTKQITVYLPKGIFREKLKNTGKLKDRRLVIPFSKLNATLQRIVKNYEADGKPFVKVRLKHIRFDGDQAFAKLDISDQKQRQIDKVIVKGYERFPKGYIKHHLRLKTGSTFSLEKLDEASTKTYGLPFVSETKPPEVLFAPDSTFVYLNLNKRRASSFDGMIGFSSKDEGSGLSFNGYLDFDLVNIFNKGEHIVLNWKNNGNNSQRFELSTFMPYLFQSPVSTDIALRIFRQDTTFNTIQFNLGVYFDLFKNGKISVLYHSENSSDIRNTNTEGFINDFKKRKLGAGLTFFKPLNDPVFRQRYLFDFRGFYAIRKTESSEYQQIAEVKMNYLWPFADRHFAFFQNQTGFLNGNNLYTNELFRLGGIYTIRGFNEESLFASFYSIANLEYRFKTGAVSYFLALSDYAYLKNDILNTRDNLFGFGIGYSFQTKAGRIDLIYALGKFQDEPLDFGQSKLHIKLVSVF